MKKAYAISKYFILEFQTKKIEVVIEIYVVNIKSKGQDLKKNSNNRYQIFAKLYFQKGTFVWEK